MLLRYSAPSWTYDCVPAGAGGESQCLKVFLWDVPGNATRTLNRPIMGLNRCKMTCGMDAGEAANLPIWPTVRSPPPSSEANDVTSQFDSDVTEMVHFFPGDVSIALEHNPKVHDYVDELRKVFKTYMFQTHPRYYVVCLHLLYYSATPI